MGDDFKASLQSAIHDLFTQRDRLLTEAASANPSATVFAVSCRARYDVGCVVDIVVTPFAGFPDEQTQRALGGDVYWYVRNAKPAVIQEVT